MAQKFGVHNLIYTPDWTETRGKAAVDSAARLGYDLFEVLMFDPAGFDPVMSRRLIVDAGLEPRLGMALSAAADISSADGETAARGKATVERCLELAVEFGAPGVSGICYAAFNNYPVPPSAVQRIQVIDVLGALDQRAGELGVRLGLEPVNRYESYLVNTIDEAGDIIRTIGGKNLFIHLDTFHMNIEEGDVAGAIERNGKLIGYVHLADNHRAMLGSGSFDFQGLFRALEAVGYTDGYTAEMFSPDILGQDLSGGISIWRGQWSDSESAAAAALAFMRSGVEVAQTAMKRWKAA
jgi:D-psicose/D-tagatose/L-ribulose 3-epimerase